jgi:hypothetical protein
VFELEGMLAKLRNTLVQTREEKKNADDQIQAMLRSDMKRMGGASADKPKLPTMHIDTAAIRARKSRTVVPTGSSGELSPTTPIEAHTFKYQAPGF